MKAASSKNLLLGLLAVLLIPVNAQNISYTSPGGLKLGFGLGSSYQKSDIKNSEGIGYDIRLGTPIYQQANAFLALDWRFRFLNGYSRAYDHRVNTDGSYNNIHLTHFNYDLELVLTLNRLRERTGIILSGFAGAGITHGITSADLLDASNNAYDYSTIVPNRDASDILADLDQLTDKDFETRLLNRAAILPTAGIYLGYQFTPHFALGLEHKMNFSLSEDNSAFGIDIDNLVAAGSSPDWNNYTSIVFKWALGGGSGGRGRIPVQDTYTVPAQEVYPPQVDIVDPYTNPFETTQSSVKVSARVHNISNKEEISVKLNGQDQDFMYYSSINRIDVNTNLRMGSNSLDIFCQNDAGSDSDHLILHLRIPSVKNPPALKFINPPTAIEVEQDSYAVKIQSSNIATRDDLTLAVNGKRIYDFDYDRNGIINLGLDLNEGPNEIAVTGKNADGTVSERTSIHYIRPAQGFPPEVKIVRPAAPRVNSYESTIEIQAEIRNVESYRDIKFIINGINTSGFSFNPTTRRLNANVPLTTSTTNINISAQNNFGSHSDSRIIVKEYQPIERQTVERPPVIIPPIETQPCPKPVISFSVTESGTSQLRGIVHNVRNRGDIQLNVNGRQISNWRYFASTGEIQASLNFDPGTHTIEMNATNGCGRESESKILVIEAPCIPPQVTLNISEVAAENTTHLLSALLQNVSIRDNVNLLVNGTLLSNFRFNPNSGQVTANLNLDPGSHNIMVVGMNDCGSNRASKTVVIEAPCQLPTVNMSISEVTAENLTHQLSALLQNVSRKSDITLQVNGNPQTNFRFNLTTGRVSANFNLDPGSHTIVLMAKNSCGTATEADNVSVKSPCNPPVVSFNVSEITSESATHRLSGIVQNVKNKRQVILTVNGRPDNGFQFVPGTGEISSSFKFYPGKQTIAVHVNNQCGSDSETTTITVAQPCIPPSVSFNISEVNSASATHRLSGETQNVKNKSQVTLTVNGRPDNGFQFVPATGEISSNFKLPLGSHTIILSVQNECGRDSETTTITVAQPCAPPTVSFNISEINSASASHRLSGEAQNVKNKSQVTLTVNGRPDNGFQFVPATGEISNNFKLTPGSHTIILSVQNECGRDSETTTITVAQPCIPPSVSFNISEVNSASATHRLSGETQNVKNKSQVTLTVNGRPDNGFQFVPATGEISSNFKLPLGSHTIILSVQNECGSDSETTTITVAQPCIPPSVSFNISEVNSASATHRLSGETQNVKNKSQVTLTVNGRPDNGFQFVPATGEISNNFKLTPGSHTIILSVQNECGRDSETTTITVAQPCIPPSVSFNISEVNSASATHRLSGETQNVKNKSQVTLTVNGRPDNGFQFVPATGEISSNFKLTPGTHTIIIRVNNECGSDSESKQVMVIEAPVEAPVGGVNTNPNAGWVRINPGNAPWQFCLQTPGGNYTRDNLSNRNFSYSGTASSLYIQPIAGGGTAIVNGKAFNLNSGQYYLFRGNLKVQVTNKRQGAMGHWSVYIESINAPLTGKGNNRPKSPCETRNNNRNR